MSDDVTEFLGSSRSDELMETVDGDPNLRSIDNPLVKGLVILLMLAVATTVLAATRDDGGTTVAASDVIASEPLAPVAETTTSTSTVPVEPAESSPELLTQPWAASQAIGLPGAAGDELRQQILGQDETTTTAEPTTTAAPTTKAPTTEAPATTAAPATTTTTAPASTEEPATSAPSGAEGEAAPAGETAEGDTTTTTAATETTPATEAPAETTTTANGDGWVDAGHGVLVPRVLLAIRYCESTDNYQAANPSSSARGAYQFLTGSWEAYGHAARYGVSRAHLATNAQQDEAALITWQRDGTRPWNASKHCWSKRI